MSDDAGSCSGSQHGGEGSEGSTASVREDHSIITVAAEPGGSGDEEPLTTVVISGAELGSPQHNNGGIDNMGFQSDISSGGSLGKPPAEAVNLELVNMTPFGEDKEKMALGNGAEISVKNGKDAEQPDSVISENYNSDPYDEYFVPVNEHRKYIRGEKLYVTKDKRQQHKWRRTVCWGVALTLLAAAVLIAVLAATGVILSQEESSSMNAKLAVSPATTKEDSKGEIIPSVPPPVSLEPEQNFVPRALEGKLSIQQDFSEALSRPDSPEFKQLASSLEEEIKNSLFDRNTLNYGAANIMVKIIDFAPGSVVARYRIAWSFKDGIHNPIDPITMEQLQTKMSSYLNKNGNFLYVYKIAPESVSSARIMDPCQANNGGCSHTCGFDYSESLTAMCTCPPGFFLSEDKKTCTDAPMTEVEDPVRPVVKSDVESGRHFPDFVDYESSSEQATVSSDHDHGHHQSSTAEPEPTGDHDHDHSHAEPEPAGDHDHSHAEPEPTGDHDHSLAEPEPTSDHDHNTKAEPEPTNDHDHHEHIKAEPEPTTDHDHDTKAEPEPTNDHDHHEHTKAEPEPTIDHDNDSKAEPEPSGDHDHHDLTKAEPEPTGDHDSKAEPEPTSEHDTKAEPEPSSNHDHDTNAEPEPTGDHHDHDHSTAEPETTKNHDHDHEIKAEPEQSGDHEHAKAEPEPSGDHDHVKSEPEPTSDHESKAEPEPSNDHDHHVIEIIKPSSEHKNEEEKAKPEPSSDHDHKEHEGKAEPEPSSEPASEHKEDEEKVKPEPSTDHEHSMEKIVPVFVEHAHEEIKPSTESSESINEHHDKHEKPEMSEKPHETGHVEMKEEMKGHEPIVFPTHVNEDKESKPEKSSEDSMRVFNVMSTHEETSQKQEKAEEIPDQVYSDHNREVDDDDVIGPLVLESKPLLEKNEGKISELEVAKKLESSTESQVKSTEKEHRGIFDHEFPELPKEEMTGEKMDEEHQIKDENDKPTERLPMMERPSERFNDLHVVNKHDSPIEVVQLVPINNEEKHADETSSEKSADHEMKDGMKLVEPMTEMSVEKMEPETHMSSSTSSEMEKSSTSTEEPSSTSAAPKSESPSIMVDLKPVHEVLEEGSTQKQAESSTVESTPSPSTTAHTPSVEHSPSSEPEVERPEDYDTNNDLLLHDDDTPEKLGNNWKEDIIHGLIVALSTETPKTKNHTEVDLKSSDNEEVNDLFVKDKVMPSSEAPLDVLISSTTSAEDTREHHEVSSEKSASSTSSEENVFHELEDAKEKKKATEFTHETHELFGHPGEHHFVTSTKKPEKKLSKNKHHEKENDESSEGKVELEHRKLDRLGVALGAEEDVEMVTEMEFTTLMPELKKDTKVIESSEMVNEPEKKPDEEAKMSEENSEDAKIDVRLKTNEEEKTTSTEESVTEKEMKTIKEMEAKEMKESEEIQTTTMLPAVEEEMTKLEVSSETPREVQIEKRIDEKSNESEKFEEIPVTEQEMSTEKMTEEEAKKEESSTEVITEKTEEVSEKSAEVKLANEGVKTEEMVEDTKEKDSKESAPVVEITTTTAAPTRAPAPVFEEPAPPPPTSTLDPTAASFSKCTAGQFQCLNGTSHTGSPCVSLSSKCDSINDCSDASDELGCMEDGCPGNFQCSNKQCLKRHLVCNGIVDCTDASDEKDCENWKCKFDELQCPSGRCIPLLWQCDGKADCENHSDEQNCQASCGNQEYMCPERWCIPLAWKCNGRADCAQGEDEKLCDCSLEQFRCAAGGCVAKSQVCDGEGQCPDQSDEWDCLRVNNETLRLQVKTPEQTWLGVCSDNWDNEWSNAACQSLGYSDAVYTKFLDIEGEERLLKLKPSAANASSVQLLGALEKAPKDTCASGKAVEVDCQDFTCGRLEGPGTQARLVGGDRAAEGQWSSVALLYNKKAQAGCTASILSPVWLIASLSCLTNKDKSLNPTQWQVYAGGPVFQPDNPMSERTQSRAVRTLVAHPQARFNRFLYEHDVVLVRLAQPFSLSGPNVGAICLTSRTIEPRQLCVTAGWGYNSRNQRDGSLNQYLHYLPLPTFDMKECNDSKHYNGLISQDHICAGYTDAERSPCDNDEGAPLMCIGAEEGVWKLHGLLSYHSHCGRGYHPSIYSSVPALRSWIDSTLGSHFFAADDVTTTDLRR